MQCRLKFAAKHPFSGLLQGHHQPFTVNEFPMPDGWWLPAARPWLWSTQQQVSIQLLVATVATVATVAGAWCSSSRRDGGAPSDSGAEQQTTFLVKHTLFN